jgi:hypothetical protein
VYAGAAKNGQAIKETNKVVAVPTLTLHFTHFKLDEDDSVTSFKILAGWNGKQ